MVLSSDTSSNLGGLVQFRLSEQSAQPKEKVVQLALDIVIALDSQGSQPLRKPSQVVYQCQRGRTPRVDL